MIDQIREREFDTIVILAVLKTSKATLVCT